MDGKTIEPFKLCYIGQPFFIWPVCMEFTGKKIFSNILRIPCTSCATMAAVLNGGLDALCPTYPENSLVVHMNVIVMT